MPLIAGSRLGPYEILAPIGAGGMGEVYRARDSRLKRIVAIKVLSSIRSMDEDSRRRFQTEARAISGLNHPHICTLFDVGEEDSIEYLVMEYVDGETLASRLKQGPLATGEALLYAGQILSALDHAHQKRIVHRDLKPANIMLAGHGSVRLAKLLDFGLARITGPVHNGEETMTAVDATEPGMIGGTPQYLAPEALQGAQADARADIHAFGAILYEMLTGTKAFAGATKGDVFAAIMRDEPKPLSSVVPHTSPAIEMLVKRCLRKNPDERWQTAADLHAALQLAALPSIDAGTVNAPPAKRGIPAWSLAAVALIATVTTVLLVRRTSPSEPARPARFVIVAPEKHTLLQKAAAPSPDGRNIVFVARDPSGETALWLRALDSRNAQRLAGTEGAIGPFWSPDSSFVGFYTPGKLKKLNLSTGSVQNICNANTDLGATWNNHGDIVFAPSNRTSLFRVPAAGGEPVAITTLDTARKENSHRWPHFLPDGRHFLFTARSSAKENTAVWAGSLDSREIRRLIPAQSNVSYAEPGYLLFVREGTLLAQRFDTGKLALTGEPLVIASNVSQTTPSASGDFAVSPNGSVLVYQDDRTRRTQISWFDRSGVHLADVGAQGDYTQPHLSPDGKRLAVVAPDRESGNRDIWIMDLATGAPTRFTSDPANDWFPVWSPDGQYIAFSSDRTAPSSLLRKPANGEGAEELLLHAPGGAVPTDWSADGRSILFQQLWEAGNSLSLWALPLTGAPKPFSLLNSTFSGYGATLSPDGKWIAFVSTESGKHDVYVKPFDRPGKLRISPAGGDKPVWSRNSRELYYEGPESLMTVDIKPGVVFEAASPHPLFRSCPASTRPETGATYDVSADGKRFLVVCTAPGDTPSTLVVNLNILR